MKDVGLIPQPPIETAAILGMVLDLALTLVFGAFLLSAVPRLWQVIFAPPLGLVTFWKFCVWVDIVEAVR